jgi:hypothetical protein
MFFAGGLLVAAPCTLFLLDTFGHDGKLGRSGSEVAMVRKGHMKLMVANLGVSITA